MEEARVKWVDLEKELATLVVEVRQMPKLEVEGFRVVHETKVERLQSSHQAEVERLCGLHSTKIERKDAFCETEKVWMQFELQASYISKLPGLYDEQYELGYWVDYAEVERIAHKDPKPSSDDASSLPIVQNL